MRTRTLKVVAVAALASLSMASADAVVTSKDRRRSRLAVRYLTAQQETSGAFPGFSAIGSTADAVVSMVAARRAPRAIERALAYLEGTADEIQTVGQKAKVVLALYAAGREPVVAGRNLLDEIEASQQESGQYGDGSDFTAVFTHALAMLATKTARTTVDAGAAAWLVQAQCADGGWQYDAPAAPGDDEHCWDGSETDFSKTDTNTTSYAVQALSYAPDGITPEVNPFRFFRRIRDEAKRGWGYTWDFPMTDTNSTALVIQAYRSRGVDLPRGAKGALRRLQYRPCSRHGAAFAYSWVENPNGVLKKTGPDAGATIGGILGLLERPLPVRYFQVKRGAPTPTCR